jgi:alkylated DNA repair dioxygenase AlkB
MFGRTLMQPRLIRFMGEAGVEYRYSGGRHDAAPWHPALTPLLERLQRACPPGFNCVLLNLYRDGRDSMGWHADDEPELGPRPTIASISLGAVRRFQLRSLAQPRQRFEIQPEHGSLLVMSGSLQDNWQHQVPKTARPVGPRINLTFRRIPSSASLPDPVPDRPIG